MLLSQTNEPQSVASNCSTGKGECIGSLLGGHLGVLLSGGQPASNGASLQSGTLNGGMSRK